MHIFKHLILNERISGIGPLMIEQDLEPASLALYGRCRYYFELHLTGHTTKIYSDWFNTRTDPTGSVKVAMDYWKAEYHQAYKDIGELFSNTTKTFAL